LPQRTHNAQHRRLSGPEGNFLAALHLLVVVISLLSQALAFSLALAIACTNRVGVLLHPHFTVVSHCAVAYAK
ncbi:hypothetical protein, partial [Pseudomonas ficuserectae]|uniref:hypothetical protein n=1 Tax=Pseudomonas ficuserectae TaxID=53410 RepID=UPI001C7F5036